MVTNEDFVTFKQAEILNSLGFDWDTHKYYVIQNYCEGNNPVYFDTYGYGELISSPKYKQYENGDVDYDKEFNMPAPTLEQAHKWIRKNHDITIIVKCWYNKFFPCVHVYNEEDDTVVGHQYDTYEDALSRGITFVLEKIIK